MSKNSKTIPNHVLQVLTNGTAAEHVFILPPGQLDRALYVEVDKVLRALGGKWNRAAKAHVFDGSAADRVAGAIASGTYEDPKALAFFATPAKLAMELVNYADVQSGHTCLEPSAGEGALALAMAQRVPKKQIHCIEVDPTRASKLNTLGFRTTLADFLEVKPQPIYHRIVMNPPFAVPGKPKADIEHVRHAFRFLQPGGLLVSVMAAGVEFQETRMVREFRAEVDDCGGHIGRLPEDSFAESGTHVRAVFVVIYKP